MIGKTILHYRILEKLGEGGMGVVYKAEDTKLKRDVAIKFLPRQIAGSDEERQRFKIEAQAAAALNHPNIATIHAIEEHDDEMFIVMEYIEGRELRDIVQSEIPKLQSAIDYATQIASGLQAAHKKGVVHRDIKSSNIMITDEGQVKIMDFGLAKIRGGAKFTKVGTTLGTAAYMSPEQARGEEVDHLTDIWAFGVVLYEMLTGQLPFKGDYEQAVIYSILNEEPQSITALRPELPEELERMANKMLTKMPSHRYQKIEGVLADLRTCGDTRLSLEERADPDSKSTITKAPRLIIAAALALVLLLFVLWNIRKFGWNSPEQMSPTSDSAIAVLPFSVRGNAEFNYLGEGMVDLLSTKLDGAGGWRSVDPRAILGFVDRYEDETLDPESGKGIAQRLSARFYVLGNILEIGGRLQLHASLYDRKRGLDAVAEGTAAGDAAQLFGLVDEVAARLLVGRSDGSRDRVDRIEAVTTSSLPALKAYLEGETAFRRGQFQPAVDAFQRAVAADSSFALAYYRLSVAAEWRTISELSFTAAQQALSLADRLSERDRRLLEAFLAYRQGKAAEAEQLYRTIIDAYPDDVEALIQLAEVLFHYNPLHGRPFAESQDVFERVLYYEPDDAASLIHLARITASQDRLEEMNGYVQKALEVIPTGDRELEMRTLKALAPGSQTNIDQLKTRLRTAGELLLTQAVYVPLIYTQKIQGIKGLTSLMTSPTRTPEVRILGHSWLAYLHVATGEWQLAKQEMGAIRSDDPVAALENRALLSSLPFLNVPVSDLEKIRRELEQTKPVEKMQSNPSLYFNVHDDIHTILQSYLLGLLSTRLGDNDAALQHATQLEQLHAPEAGGTIAADLALTVRAQISLGDNRLEQALALLEQTRNETWYHKTLSSPFYAQTHQRFMRAELLRKLGRGEEALGWYASLPAITPFGLVYLAISHLRRGEIYESLGQKEQAVGHYSRFVEFWRDCDSELRPLLEEAQEKLTELRKVTTQ